MEKNLHNVKKLIERVISLIKRKYELEKMDIEHLKSSIRNVPDYPKPGIQFKDIPPIWQEPIIV